MSFVLPLRRRHRTNECASETGSARQVSNAPQLRTAYSAELWSWVARMNRSRLLDITLAHVLSGDTVSPISLPEFEAFLAFCDISLENLQFIVWYQDYRERFIAHFPTSGGVVQQCDVTVSEPCVRSTSDGDIVRLERVQSSVSSSQSSGNSSNTEGLFSAKVSNNTALPSPISPGSFTVDSSLSLRPQQTVSTSDVPPFGSNPPHHSSATPLDSRSSASPFVTEVENVIATFLAPGARKELLLPSDVRDRCVRATRNSIHPDVFLEAYNQIYELCESVSLPRFLSQGSTNINRPRQLFWYLSALPMFFLGLAIALFFICSPRFALPPQSHRAWRLLSLPCFFLASLMWYKGFRGFCPILFLRARRQLHSWELQIMSDTGEAQRYVHDLSHSTHGHRCSVPTTPVAQDPASSTHPSPLATPISPDRDPEKDKSHIAPFLDDFDSLPPGALPQSGHGRYDRSSTRGNEQFPARRPNQTGTSRNDIESTASFQRPPVFGPSKVIEDARIKRVHHHLWWSLIRFGIICTALVSAIIVAVPNAR